VGIAIGHSMEPLEDILKFGRDAEKAAKMAHPSMMKEMASQFIFIQEAAPPSRFEKNGDLEAKMALMSVSLRGQICTVKMSYRIALPTICLS